MLEIALETTNVHIQRIDELFKTFGGIERWKKIKELHDCTPLTGEDPLVIWYNHVINKTVTELTVADVARCIRQALFIETAYEVLIAYLLHNPYEGDVYEGELMDKASEVDDAVNQLYRPGSFIGDGGTASVIKFERATGIGLGSKGNTHMQKGQEMLKYIENKILTQKNLSASDRKLAQQLAKSLKKAMWR